MALIIADKIIKIDKSSRVQKAVDCTYNVFEIDDVKYIQFDTYGTSKRMSESKSSQTIQFDKKTAKYLVQILKREFGL